MNLLQHGWEHVQGFDCMPVPENLYKEDIFLWDLKEKYQGRAVFLRMNPYSLYNWHKDLYRNVVINSIIEGFDSFTFFTNEDPNYYQGTSMQVEELTYLPAECYLLDTSKNHAVYNRNSRRTVLSLYFDHEVQYKEIYFHAKKMNYIL